MSGEVVDITLPRRPGERSQIFGGGASLHERPGPAGSRHERSYRDGSKRWDCAGELKNHPYPDLQARTLIARSGKLRLVVDAFSLGPDEHCTPGDGGWDTPIGINGWPQGYTLDLPPAPHAQRTLTLTKDWYRWYENCGLAETREGVAGAPPPVEEDDGFFRCVYGEVTRIRAHLELRRTCAHVRFKVRGGDAGGRCIRR